MAIIGTIGIGVTATVGKAVSGLRSLKREIFSVGSAAGSIVGKIGAVSGALSGIAGAAGLTALVKNSFESIDATGKLAAKLGIATENLVAFQHQADLAGVASGTFEKALQAMVKGVDDASRGTGEAKDAFAALNLDPSALAKGSVENTYKAIADAIMNTDGAQKQLALTMQIFGSRGADLIHILRQGAKGFEDARAEAERLGITFSDIDSQQVQAANDAITTMGAAIKGVTNRIAIGLAPIVEAVANKFTDWISSTNKGLDVTTSVLHGVIKVIGFLSDLIYGLKLLWSGVEIAANAVFFAIIKGVESASRGLDKLLQSIGLTATGFTEEIGYLATALGEQLDTATNNFQALADAGRPSAEIENKWNAIADAARKAAENAAKMQQAARDAVPAMEELAVPTKKVDEILQGLRDKLATLTLSEDARTLQKLVDNNATQQQLDEARKILDEIKSAKISSDLDKRAADIIKDIQTPAEKLAQRIREIEEVGNRLTDEQRQAAIAKANRDILGGAELPGAPAALVRGSIEARSAELEGLRRLRGERDMDQTLKEQLKTQKDATSTLKEILRAIADGTLTVSDN